MLYINLRRLWSRHLIPFVLMAVLAPCSFAQNPVSQGKPVVASSQEGNLSPTAIVDGNNTTRWASNYSDAEWVYIDLGAKTTLSRVLLNWEAAYGKAYQIQVSDNASSWTTIYSSTAGDGGIDDFTVSGSGRYVRLNGIARGTGWGYSLWEFQVYGTGAVSDVALKGFTACTSEGNECITGGPATVAYGANGKYFFLKTIDSIPCDNTTFEDPIANTPKSCFYKLDDSSAPVGFTFCANENETCAFVGSAKVMYGANGKFFSAQANGSIECSHTRFGDPIFGVVKSCYYQAADANPAGFATCAAEGLNCEFSGKKTIAYGANGVFTFKQATDSINCNNSIFSDPIVGVKKSCLISKESNAVAFDVTNILVTNTNGQAPSKGDAIRVTMTVVNTGTTSGSATLTPLITSLRFSDYNNVNLPSVRVHLNAGAQGQVSLDAGPFFQDGSDHYALGSGSYRMSGVKVGNETDNSFTGAEFSIATSNAVFVPVVYDQAYLATIGYVQGISHYLTSAFTRPSELFTESGSYIYHAGGFDEMMGVRQMFYPLPGFTLDPSGIGYCEQTTAQAGQMLGLQQDWTGPLATNTSNHGFDYLIGLSPQMGGGATCGWINVQVSGLFNFDLSLNRSQIIMVHETGHIFGAPHCEGLSGYVMCAGEVHDHYINQNLFVWLYASRNLMNNRWN